MIGNGEKLKDPIGPIRTCGNQNGTIAMQLHKKRTNDLYLIISKIKMTFFTI